MPVVTDLQVWADDLEVVRLPHINSEIATLQTDQASTSTLLTQKVQEFTDRLDAHTVSIAAAQTDADKAESDAFTALTRINQVDVDAVTYTDAKIQELRDELSLLLQTELGTVQSNLSNQLTQDINAITPNLELEISNTLAQVTALKDQTAQLKADSQAAIDGLTTTVIPGIDARLGTTEGVSASIRDNYNLFITDYEHPTLLGGLDEIRAEAESNLVPLKGGIFREPRGLWGRNIQTPTSTLARTTLGNFGTFVTNDASFGDAFLPPAGEEANYGPAYPIDFVPGRIYKITATVRAISDGGGSGVHVALGANISQGLSSVQTAYRNFSPNLLVAEGVQSYSAYVSSDLTALNNYGVSASQRIHLSSASAAATNKLYFCVVQNRQGTTGGQLALGSLTITDVTDVATTAQAIRSELAAEVGTINATLTNDYYTIVAADEAIAAADLALKSEIEDPLGSSLGATLQNNYRTEVDTDTAIASAVDALEATILTPAGTAIKSNLLTNYYTKAGADSAISNATTALKAQIEDPNGSSVGADLATNYRTEADTDTAISQATTALKSEMEGPMGSVGSVTADLANNYRTTVDTDAAISQATTNLQSEMEGPGGSIGSLSADLQNNYYTITAADTAISDATTALKSEMEGPTGSVGSVTADLANNYRTAADTDTAISVATTDLKSEMEAPTGSIGSLSATLSNDYYTKTDTDQQITSATTALKSAIEDPLGTSIGADLENNYYTITEADGAISTATTDLKAEMEGPTGSIGSLSATLQNDYLTAVDTNAAISSAQTTLQGNIDANSADITDILQLRTTPQTAFASMLTELSVDANGQIAGITNFGAVMADIEGNSSASYVMRAKAGGAAGEIEIAAFADANGGAATAVTISADVMTFTGGLAMFGGTLQSSDFVTGVSGWQINEDGTMELQNLIQREAIVDDAIDTPKIASQAVSRVDYSVNTAISGIGTNWIDITWLYVDTIAGSQVWFDFNFDWTSGFSDVELEWDIIREGYGAVASGTIKTQGTSGRFVGFASDASPPTGSQHYKIRVRQDSSTGTSTISGGFSSAKTWVK